MGREAFRGRPGNHNWNARVLAEICENMASADTSRAREFDAFASRATGDDAAATHLLSAVCPMA